MRKEIKIFSVPVRELKPNDQLVMHVSEASSVSGIREIESVRVDGNCCEVVTKDKWHHFMFANSTVMIVE